MASDRRSSLRPATASCPDFTVGSVEVGAWAVDTDVDGAETRADEVQRRRGARARSGSCGEPREMRQDTEREPRSRRILARGPYREQETFRLHSHRSALEIRQPRNASGDR